MSRILSRGGGRPNEVDRLLAGFLPSETSEAGARVETSFCDGDVGCTALQHEVLCRAAGDPLANPISLRARRIA